MEEKKIEIREVKTLKELKQFIKFEFDLYKNNKYWVPPLFSDELNTLRKDVNPAFDICEAVYYTSWKDNKMVGRIAGIIQHNYIKKWGNKYARFGWFDFIDDFEVSKALFDKVTEWAKSKGMVGLNGPLGFTDLDYEGLLIEGFEELNTMATLYNYPYYVEHYEKLGLKKDADWVEFEIKVPKSIPEKAEKLSKIVKERFHLHVKDIKNINLIVKKYGREVFEVIEKAYKNLYGVTELTERQIQYYIKTYFSFLSPKFVKLVFNEEDKIVGMVVGIPSLNRALQKAKGRLFPFGFIHLLLALKKPKYLDLLLGAVLPEYQGKGVDALMMTELTRSAMEAGIISAESNPELEVNEKVQGHWKYFEARQHKRRRAYLKLI
ncbi:MAG TPA: GCN5 family acetyltransferase [Exilispira sp.]|nr:GCN5 family acetyltransferase [Exilispira sp.]